MKIVEVVVLLGAQCVSPVQHIDMETVAGKVPCGVVIHKDTERRTVTVVPASEAGNPKVQLALRMPDEQGGNTAVATVPQAPSASPELFKGQLLAGGRPASVPKQIVERLQSEGTGPDGERVEPASSPPDNLPVAIAPPPSFTPAAVPDAGQPEASPQPETAPEETAADKPVQQKPAPAAEARPKKPMRVAEAQPKRQPSATKGQCRGSAKPVWYTNKSGAKKYRCAVPGKNRIY